MHKRRLKVGLRGKSQPVLEEIRKRVFDREWSRVKILLWHFLVIEDHLKTKTGVESNTEVTFIEADESHNLSTTNDHQKSSVSVKLEFVKQREEPK
jgi:hypothetical protein